MTEEQKEMRTCEGCGQEYEYTPGAVLGEAKLGEAVVGSDPEYCPECAGKKSS